MQLAKLTLAVLFATSVTGCSTIKGIWNDDDTSTKQVEMESTPTSQAEIDLLIEKAKAEERIRIEREYERQDKQAQVFALLKEKQDQLKSNLEDRADGMGTMGQKIYAACFAKVNLPNSGGEQERQVLCKEDRSKAVVEKIQVKLAEAGYLKPSPPNDLEVIDGLWGPNTASTIVRYQQDNNLAYKKGEITFEFLRKIELMK